MSWDNYGIYWQIDHVNPLKNFNLLNTEYQKSVFNWKNTRPLEKIQNLSKKYNNIIDINEHNKKVYQFLIATSSN